MTSQLAALDAEIATAWPLEWMRANNPSRPGASKRRNNLRKRWRWHIELEAFKSANPDARCGNCAHCSHVPHSTTAKLCCDLDSDFHGYQLTSAEDVCARWIAQPPSKDPTHDTKQG